MVKEWDKNKGLPTIMGEQDGARLRSEDGRHVSPGKGSAEDFSKMNGASLAAKQTELQKKIVDAGKLMDEYKKKVKSLLSQLSNSREPSQILCKEAMSSRDCLQEQLLSIQRNKETVFKRLLVEVEEQRERVKGCDDHSSEARRQIEEGKSYLRRERHYYEMMQMSNFQKIHNYFFETLKWIEDAIWALFR